MKFEVDSPKKLTEWLATPVAAVFQGQDLVATSDDIAARPLKDCVFLGCRMAASLALAVAQAQCVVFPRVDGLTFDPFTPGLYTPAELFDKFDPANPDSKKLCRDWLIYASFIDPVTKIEIPSDVDTVMLRRLHDASIADALDELLEETIVDRDGKQVARRSRAVAIMGGHDEPRSETGIFADIAALSLEIARAGYFMVTGGGPGLMEAANLGAYVAGFANPEQSLKDALRVLKDAPRYDHTLWLSCGYQAWKALGAPASHERSRSLGIPTWFYGHEPPNLFATDIAKYFENSVREEGMLGVALGGVIFAKGNAGTVQEIFQDACQNYYRTYAKTKSAMILLDSHYWNATDPVFHHGGDDEKRKKVYPLLEKLATEKAFSDYVLLTDTLSEVVNFLDRHRPTS